MKVGVESAHSFGDALFNIPLIKAISEKWRTKIVVATRKPYRDAFHNIPWVDETLVINSMGDGERVLRQHGCKVTYQITQNVKFFEFKQHDSEHSLIDTPLLTGRQIGLADFDQRPIFMPTDAELKAVQPLLTGQKTIAVESEYRSGQSWATADDFNRIREKFKDYRILWLSNKDAPPEADNMLRFTRRQVILALQACDIFFSVGSGFFCSSLALPTHLQPKRIVCLWDDTLYKYERRITESRWHNNIQWVHNQPELDQCLTGL